MLYSLYTVKLDPPLSLQGKYKAPTNAQKKADGSYSYATDKTAEELYPKLSSAAGTNFFDSKAHWMSMIIQGSDPFTIKTSPKVGAKDFDTILSFHDNIFAQITRRNID